MPRLDDLLEQAVGPVDACYTVDGLGPRRTRVRRQRRARVAIACALVAGLATGAVVLTSAGGDTRRVNTPPAAGVFPDASNTVLVLDDGYDGVTLVDLDRRVAVRRVVEGQRAGDQPYRLGRAGDRLIVGWDDVYAAPLAGGASKLLGHATIWVPAAEPGRIWTVDWPGGRIGLGNPTTRLLDLTGRVLLEASFDPAIGFPAIGIPGGLAFETQEGVALWDAATNQVTARLGRVPRVSTFVSDSHGDLLAWCETECDLFHVTRLAPSGPVDHPILPPHGTTFDARNARFSPDGRLLATTGGGWITIVDSETGAPRRSFSSEPADPNLPPALAWSADGSRLYFTSDSYQQGETRLGEYVVATGDVHFATLPFGGAIRGVAVDRADVEALLDAPIGTEAACPPPAIQPSGRTGACAFEF